MGDTFSSIDELGDGYGFRKVRRAMGVEAFGANVLVFPPGQVGFLHYHDTQDELYFVHAGTARFVVGDVEREVGPGALCHVRSTIAHSVSNVGDDDLVVFAVGASGGYVERDGHLVDPADAERRAALGKDVG